MRLIAIIVLVLLGITQLPKSVELFDSVLWFFIGAVVLLIVEFAAGIPLPNRPGRFDIMLCGLPVDEAHRMTDVLYRATALVSDGDATEPEIEPRRNTAPSIESPSAPFKSVPDQSRLPPRTATPRVATIVVPHEVRALDPKSRWLRNDPLAWDQHCKAFEKECRTALGADYAGKQHMIDQVCDLYRETSISFITLLLEKLKQLSVGKFFQAAALLHALREVLCAMPGSGTTGVGLGAEPFGWELVGADAIAWIEGDVRTRPDLLLDAAGRTPKGGSAEPLQGAFIDQVLFPGFRIGDRVLCDPILRYSVISESDPAPAEISFPLDRSLDHLSLKNTWWNEPIVDRLSNEFNSTVQSDETASQRSSSQSRLRGVYVSSLDKTASAVLSSLETLCGDSLEAYASIVYPLRNALCSYLALYPYGWKFEGIGVRDFMQHVHDAKTQQAPESCLRGCESARTAERRDAPIFGILFPGFRRGSPGKPVHVPTVVVDPAKLGKLS